MIDTQIRDVAMSEILLEAAANGRTEVIASHDPGDMVAANTLIGKLKSHPVVTNEWRFFQRTDHRQEITKVIIMSPACKDPTPPIEQWSAKRKQERIKPEKQSGDRLHSWVLKNLTDPYMLHISVVPAEDIKRLNSVSKYETYMTAKAREALGREDVRVMVREVAKGAYNARLMFID